MRADKWKRLLAAHGIPFHEAGADNLNCPCPYCGSSDPSQHLAISLRGRGWHCLRNPDHRGRSYVRLLKTLIGCSEEQVHEILGLDINPLPPAEQFSTAWRRQLGLDVVEPKATVLTLPRGFRAMSAASPFVLPFWQYLYDRGFSPVQAEWIVKKFDLYCSTVGDYAYRIIIPVFDKERRWATWTARSIRQEPLIRYKTLSSEESAQPITDLLLGLPLLFDYRNQRRCLVVCEGPFDAMVISLLGHSVGVWGTCLFGLNVSERQADLLCELATQFEGLRLLMDRDAVLKILRILERLPKGCNMASLPEGIKDPGALIGSPKGEEFVLKLTA